MKLLSSLIMYSYNRAWALSKSLSFIQAQTLNDWELIVVDDGSTNDDFGGKGIFFRDPDNIRVEIHLD
ncbi:MAG: glycosyltransferase [Patescibacteria group bacterium]